MRAIRCLLSLVATGLLSAKAAELGVDQSLSAAVYYAPLPGHDRAFAEELAGLARGAGFTPEFIGTTTLTNAALNPGKYCLLILPCARRLPAAATTSLNNFLKAGGHLLALGVPAWSPGLFPVGNQWLSRGEFDALIAQQKPSHLIENFDRADLSLWKRASNESAAKTRWELVPQERGQAMHVLVDHYTGWDTLGSPPLSAPFPDGHTLTCFRAKGAPQTKQLALEWMEQDGSRWIATINLTPAWQQYALTPDMFKPWQPPAGRGGARDCFNPRRAARFTAGIALTHTTVSGQQHEYWLDDLGTAPNPFGDAAAPGYANPPHLEGTCPSYLFYPLKEPVRLKSPPDLALTAPCPIIPAVGPGIYAQHPRPQGAGYDQGRPWRWQPLLEASDANGHYRGAVGVFMAHFDRPYQGGIWATFTPESPSFYRSKEIRQILQDTLITLRRGLILKDGGGEFFTVFADQHFRLGATIVNLSPAAYANVTVKLQVQSPDRRKIYFQQAWSTNAAAGATLAMEQNWKPLTWPDQGLTVQVELAHDGKVIDRLVHELQSWQPKKQPAFITIRNGEFHWQNQRWKAHGVNYLPATGIGLPNQDYFEHWIGRGAYDPQVIQRDLERIKDMGLNSVSTFIYYRSLKAGHLLDFLRRCEKLGLKVNQSLRPGTPMDFRWSEMKTLIEHYRLAQNDTIFAYDLAWEPSHYDHAYQEKHYQSLWQQWVAKRYGELPKAEEIWKFSAPRQGNQLAAPASEHLFKDGPWRKMSADYRVFLDELLHARYAEARRLVQSIDPNHPVSFRMQFAGDPTHHGSGLLPYDFYGLSQAVDIWEPEAYGRIGDWDRVKPGHFTAAYARLCDPAKPVLWAEMGNSVWDPQIMAPSPDKLAFTAQYYQDFYQLLIQSGADGVFFWWYPGGYRLNENSDYGIINPDGTDREITQVIRREGRRFLKAPKPPPPNYWITVDRARDARGLPGIYESVQAEYWRAINEGKMPGLKWQTPPGKFTAP